MNKTSAKPFHTVGERLFNIFNSIFMVSLIVITLYPFLYVVFSSFSEPSRLSGFRGFLWKPLGFSTKGYQAVFSLKRFWSTYRNTIFYVVVGVVINMALTILASYVLSVDGFLLKKPFTFMVIFTMYFNGGMIPTYLIIKQMGITNTIWAILLPGCVSVYNVIVLRTSFQGIPKELTEAAEIDGASYATMLWRVVLPLSKASLATITLFYAVSRWGAWYNAMVYLTDRRDLYPLQMFLRELLIQETGTNSVAGDFSSQSAEKYLLQEVIKYAAVVASTVPILIVYPFLQKYFVKGVLVGGVKG